MFHKDTCVPVFSWPHKKTCEGTKAEAFRFLPSSAVIDRQLGTTRLLVHRQPAAILEESCRSAVKPAGNSASHAT